MKYEDVMKQKKGFRIERVDMAKGELVIAVSDDWIDTVCSAVEMQIPQKVRYLQPLNIDTVVGGLKANKSASIITECPNCRNRVRKNNKYCNECGQRLDWSDKMI